MVERMWFGSKLIGEGNGVVRLGPIAAVAEHGIDLCARGERRDTLTNLFDHSREITSGDRQGARAACRGLVGLVPLQFSGDDPCRVDAHQYLPWARMWLWDIFIHEVIGTTTVVDTDRFHGVVLFLSFRTSVIQLLRHQSILAKEKKTSSAHHKPHLHLRALWTYSRG